MRHTTAGEGKRASGPSLRTVYFHVLVVSKAPCSLSASCHPFLLLSRIQMDSRSQRVSYVFVFSQAMHSAALSWASNDIPSMRKARPCLVARDAKSQEISSRSFGSLVNPGNTDERKEVEIAAGSSMRPASRSEVGYSQASRQENVPIASRKLVREDQPQEYTNHRYMS